MINTDAILDAAMFTPTAEGWGLPLCFLAEPGTGKSSKLRALARKYGWHAEILSPSVRGMGAFGVVPVPEGAGTQMRTQNPPPAWADSLALGGLVVVDEFTTAGREIQAAMLGLMCEKIIGAHVLPGDVRVIALANPVDMAANGHEIAPPLANRVGWIDWTPPTALEHAAYLASCATVRPAPAAPIDSGAIETAVAAAWPAAMADVAALCAGFHQHQPAWKNKMPAKDDPARGGPWPSDRTWEYAARAIAIAAITHSTPGAGLTPIGPAERTAMVAGFVGAGATAALFAYAKDNAIPPIADILDGVVPWAHNPKRLDRTLTVLTGGVALVRPEACENRGARVNRLWEMLDDVGAAHGDFQKVFGDQLITANAIGTSPAASRVIMALSQIKKAR